MSLLKRLSRIVRANVNAYRRGRAEPETELSDMVADLNRAAETLRARQARARVDLRKMELELVQLRERVGELGQQARQADGEGRGETARRLLQHARAVETEADTVQDLIERQRALVDELGAAQQDLRTRIALLQRESTELTTRQQIADSQRRINELLEEAYEFDPAAVLAEIRGQTERQEDELVEPLRPEEYGDTRWAGLEQPPAEAPVPPKAAPAEEEEEEEPVRNLEFEEPEKATEVDTPSRRLEIIPPEKEG
jgi:phage shock protein A